MAPAEAATTSAQAVTAPAEAATTSAEAEQLQRKLQIASAEAVTALIEVVEAPTSWHMS